MTEIYCNVNMRFLNYIQLRAGGASPSVIFQLDYLVLCALCGFTLCVQYALVNIYMMFTVIAVVMAFWIELCLGNLLSVGVVLEGTWSALSSKY